MLFSMLWGSCDNDALATGFPPGKSLASQGGRGTTTQPFWKCLIPHGCFSGSWSCWHPFYVCFFLWASQKIEGDICISGHSGWFSKRTSDGLVQCPIKGWRFLAKNKHPGADDLIGEKGIMEVMLGDLFSPSERLKINKYFKFCELKKYRIKFIPVWRWAQHSNLLWM